MEPLGDGTGRRRSVSEVRRRAADLRDLEDRHPLRPLVLQCLRDSPADRPTARKLLAQFDELPTPAEVDDTSCTRSGDEIHVC